MRADPLAVMLMQLDQVERDSFGFYLCRAAEHVPNVLPSFAAIFFFFFLLFFVSFSIKKRSERERDCCRWSVSQVGWIRVEDKTILSMGQRTVTHSPRFLVTLENAKSKNQSRSREEEEATSRLHIRQLREADRGCYMCQLNTKPMLSQLGCVDVLGMPNCALRRIPTA